MFQRHPIYRGFFCLIALLLFAAPLFGQATCLFNATSIPVHAEGYAERLPDLTVTCTGGTSGATVSLTLFISLNTPVTNKLDDDGSPLGLTVTGAPVGSLRLSSPNTITLNAVNYTVPTPSSAPVVITLAGMRGAPATLPVNTPLTASVAGVGATFNSGSLLTLANGVPSLVSSQIPNGVPCAGSPLPTEQNFAGFLADTASSTIRVTEASPTGFQLLNAGADTGVRIVLKLTGYRTGSRVFVPDAIVGNNGTVQTTVGAYSTTPASGVYTPGANQLLLARIRDANANGVGGTPSIGLPVALTTFTGMSEVTVTAGAAFVVYEVIDTNPAIVESFHVPLFVVAPAEACTQTPRAPDMSATLAPVSTVSTASRTEPIPRFNLVTLQSDCQQMSDCNAPYYPRLSVDQTPISLTGSSRGDVKTAFVRVGNSGPGVLNFTTSIAYAAGSGWLSVTPSTGANSITLQISADPTNLLEGAYGATITVNGGVFGSATIPVTFNVGPVGIVITNVGNAASFTYGTVAPGSYAVLYGLNMNGPNLAVTFNGLAAQLVYTSPTQINLIVPSSLSGQQGAAVVVTGGGQTSNTFRVSLAANDLGIFTPGIVNFTGGQINSASAPAAKGDVVLVFLTGLSNPLTGPVTVTIGGLPNLNPLYAGPQGTFPALSQVNIAIPAALSSTTNVVPLQVCIPGTVGQQLCSNTVNLYVR